MSEIQTSHRRIILVHCDKVTTRRVMDIASVLGLLRGHKIWVILDGVIGSELVKPKFWYHLNLPTGMYLQAMLHLDTIFVNLLLSYFAV